MVKSKEFFSCCKTREARCPVCKKIYEIGSSRSKDGEIIEIEWRKCKCSE